MALLKTESANVVNIIIYNEFALYTVKLSLILIHSDFKIFDYVKN